MSLADIAAAINALQENVEEIKLKTETLERNIKALEKQNRELERRLALAEARIVIQRHLLSDARKRMGIDEEEQGRGVAAHHPW